MDGYQWSIDLEEFHYNRGSERLFWDELDKETLEGEVGNKEKANLQN